MSATFTLAEAYRKISGYMGESAFGGFPINLCYVDVRRKALAVGIPDPAAAARYRGLLARHIGDTPLVFLRSAAAIRHANKTAYNRPLIGGIVVTRPEPTGRGVGTICIAASRGDARGFVTAGHVVGAVDEPLYQPRKSEINDWLVGTATVVSNYGGQSLSDSAFVTSTAGLSAKKIWKSAKTTYTVTGTANNPQLGTTLYMQGAALAVAERNGLLAATNVTVRFADGGVQTGQWLATYVSRQGDSGAPVYLKDQDPNVRLVGLNVGFAAVADVAPVPNQQQYPPVTDPDGVIGYGVISPWDNVVADLGVSIELPQ